MVKNKKKDYSCKNCKEKSCVRFKNNVKICSGLVINPKPKHDVIRICIVKGKKWTHAFDLMIEEALSVAQVITFSMNSYLIKYPYTKGKK